MNNPHFQSGENSEPLLVGDCFTKGVVKEWAPLKEGANIPHLPFWAYLQLRSYLGRQADKSNFHRPPMVLELICLSGAQCTKTTSMAYSWLQYSKYKESDGLRGRWSEELHMEITAKQWRYVCILAHKCSISTRMQETAYKRMTHWYNTLAKLHGWNPQIPETCWRCKQEKGTLFHIW